MLTEFIEQKVVVDLRSPFVCIGTLLRIDELYLELRNADLHDLRLERHEPDGHPRDRLFAASGHVSLAPSLDLVAPGIRARSPLQPRRPRDSLSCFSFSISLRSRNLYG